MNLVERVKNILLTPSKEWQVIDAETSTTASLYTGYIMPLAAIGPIAQVIGYSVFGIRMPFGETVYRTPIGSAITAAIVSYVLGLVAVFVLALIVDALAPTFAGTKSQIQALKVTAYSSTAAWVAGIFALVPGLRLLGILGLYSIFLMYLGLPILMKAPQEKAAGYTVVVIVAAIVLLFLMAAIAARFTTMPMG